jgi:hypothetical protein
MKDGQCIIVNLSGGLLPDQFGEERKLPLNRKPSYVHDDLESARKEALRLHKMFAAKYGRFVIFQAVEQTEWRDYFTIATDPVAVLEPIEREVATIPEKAKRRRKQKP